MGNKLFHAVILSGLTALLTVLSTNVYSITYYLSSSGGQDDNVGTSESAPWRSLEKLASTKIGDGAVVLFKRGDVFRGRISTLAGTPANITLGAYGEGENPILSGSVLIENWQPTQHPQLNKQVYEADVSGLLSAEAEALHHLFVDGELMTIARYPNVDSPADTNWLKVGESAGKNAFTDPNLAAYSKPDNYWQGATLRIRNYSWTYMAVEVTNYVAANGKITAKKVNNSVELGTQRPEWGYFLDGKLEELDHPGEWYYDEAAKKVYFYPKHNANPNQLRIEGMAYGGAFTLKTNQNNAVIENISFKHYINTLGIRNTDNVTVRNCHFEHNFNGITTWNSSNLLIQNNTFINQMSDAIHLNSQAEFDVKNGLIEGNYIHNTAMFPIYGVRDNGIYQGIAIVLAGKGYTARGNQIENSSHAGLVTEGQGNHIVENNVIRRALLLLNDGGAIVIRSSGNQIRGNFLLETVGNVDDSNGWADVRSPKVRHPSYGMGISSLPNLSDNVIEDNTVAYNVHKGIYFNSFRNSVIRNNISYGNDGAQIAAIDKFGDPSQKNVIEDNIIYATAPEQSGLVVSNIAKQSTIDRNYYCNPYNRTILEGDGGYYSLAYWQQTFSQHDQRSTQCDFEFNEYTVQQIENTLLASDFEADTKGWKGEHDLLQSKMDGGSLKLMRPKDGGKFTAMLKSVPVVAGQYYRIRFSIVADGFGTFLLRQREEGNIFFQRRIAFDSTRREHEIIFQSPVDQPESNTVLILYNIDGEPANTVWLDNFALEQLKEFELNDATQKSKLFMNPTPETTTIDLGENTYKDLQGNEVTGSIQLAPFSSTILINLSSDFPISPDNPLDIKAKDYAANGQVLGGILYSLNEDGTIEFYQDNTWQSTSLEALGYGMPLEGFEGKITGVLYLLQRDSTNTLPEGTLIVTNNSNKVYLSLPEQRGEWITIDFSDSISGLFSIPGDQKESIFYLKENEIISLETQEHFSIEEKMGLPINEPVKLITRDEAGLFYYLVTESNQVHVATQHQIKN